MGEYAQDIVDAGMYEKYPFGQRSPRGRQSMRSDRPREPSPAPENVSDDHFTRWYDELRSSPGGEKLSEYEVAAMAWHEAVRRIRPNVV